MPRTPDHGHAKPAAPSTVPVRGRFHIVMHGVMSAGDFVRVSSRRSSASVYLATSDGDFELAVDASSDEGSGRPMGAALVAPNAHTRLAAHQAPFVCFDVFPPHRAYRHLIAPAGQALRQLPRTHFAELAPALRDFHAGVLPPDECRSLYRRVIELTLQLVPEAPPLDPRVREVMRLLEGNRELSLQALADSVFMSKDWLSHLFRRELGITLVGSPGTELEFAL